MILTVINNSKENDELRVTNYELRMTSYYWRIKREDNHLFIINF